MKSRRTSFTTYKVSSVTANEAPRDIACFMNNCLRNWLEMVGANDCHAKEDIVFELNLFYRAVKLGCLREKIENPNPYLNLRVFWVHMPYANNIISRVVNDIGGRDMSLSKIV